MCSKKTKRRIHNANRYLILVLLSLGFYINDYSFSVSDICFLLASVIWLWWTEFDRAEEYLIDSLQRKKSDYEGRNGR